jgi:glutamate-1-semialdehyde 2,1-aminomutase
LRTAIKKSPSQFEAGFLSTEHGDAEIELTLRAAEQAFVSL